MFWWCPPPLPPAPVTLLSPRRTNRHHADRSRKPRCYWRMYTGLWKWDTVNKPRGGRPSTAPLLRGLCGVLCARSSPGAGEPTAPGCCWRGSTARDSAAWPGRGHPSLPGTSAGQLHQVPQAPSRQQGLGDVPCPPSSPAPQTPRAAKGDTSHQWEPRARRSAAKA